MALHLPIVISVHHTQVVSFILHKCRGKFISDMWHVNCFH